MRMLNIVVRNNWGKLLGAAVFLGLSLLNIRSTHDWGDDFAMYIHQAKNIVEGVPQTENGYLYSPATHYYGPKAYSVGYPFFLAPIYALFGNSIFHFELANALLAFSFALLSWRFLYLLMGSLFPSFVFTFVLISNPWFIEFKGSVLSEFLFTNLLFGIVLLLSTRQPVSYPRALGIGLLLGWALLTRSIGVTVWAAIAAMAVIGFFGRKKVSDSNSLTLPSSVILLFVSIATFAFFQYLLFPAPTLGSYAYSIDVLGMLKSISKTADYYIVTARDIIPNAGPIIIQTVLYHFVIVGVIFGFFVQIRQQVRLVDWIFIFYFALLFIWPGLQGFRLLLPIVPFALAYLYTASDRIWPEWVKSVSSKPISILILLATIIPFFHPVTQIQKRIHIPVDGPQAPAASEALNYIRETLPKDSITSFRKARAFSLYTGRNAISDPDGSSEEILAHFRTMRAQYALIDYEFTEKDFQSTVKKFGTSLWKNGRFELYKLNL